MVQEFFAADELAQARGKAPAIQEFVNADPAPRAAYNTPDAIVFYLPDGVPEDLWENRFTVQSSGRSRSYDPGNWIDQISPTPLMMVVGTHDTVTPTDLALGAYERALEPKELVLMPGGASVHHRGNIRLLAGPVRSGLSSF